MTQPNPLQARFDVLYQASRQHTDVPWPVRQQRLQQLARMVREHRHAIADAIHADFGNRSRHETDLLELFPTLAGIRHALKHGKQWMCPRKVATDWWFWPARNRILPQPLGVVGIIAPWNYPLFLTTGPLIAALVAGNRALVKTSEHAPAFGQWLAHTVPQYFAADELAIIEGDADVAAAFSALPFDHLLFTGSTAVGRLVMRAAAANLTPVTLELGGKSPTLILDDADLDQAVARVMSGKLVNAGQTCIAPDYVLLPPALQAAFIEKARAWVAQHYPNLAANRDYSHIINPTQLARLQGYLQQAAAAGAEIVPLVPDATNQKCRQQHPIATAYCVQHPRPQPADAGRNLRPVVAAGALPTARRSAGIHPRPPAPLGLICIRQSTGANRPRAAQHRFRRRECERHPVSCGTRKSAFRRRGCIRHGRLPRPHRF